MKLIEHDAKKILKEAGILIPPTFIDDLLPLNVAPNEIRRVFRSPGYLKAQVVSGRRYRRGLVVRVDEFSDMESILRELQLKIGGEPCAGFLCEAELKHVGERFISFDLDRELGVWRFSWSQQGGVTVAHAFSFDNSSDIPGPLRPFFDEFKKLLSFKSMADALHVEINPLAETADGQLIALDAKIELDDAAAFRHTEWSSFHRLPEIGRVLNERELAYQTLTEQAGHRGTFGKYLEMDGDIALILSGGGASLVALDALDRAGGRAANYCEMSGNPDPALVRQAADIVFSRPGLKAIWIAGSFANFTDIAATIRATLQAVDDDRLRIPIVIRRDGPNADQAEQESIAWAKERSVQLQFHRADVSLEESAKRLMSSL